MSLRSNALKGGAFAILRPSGLYAEVVTSAREAINIWEGYSHGEVTGWRRSCSSADTYNMKVQKSAERELGCSQPSAPLLTNAKYRGRGTWSTVQFFLREGASKINQITHTMSEKKATQRVISLIRCRDLAIITVSLFLVLNTVSFTSIIHAGLCHSALSCIWMGCLPWCGDLEGTYYLS